jgi:transposase
MVRLRDRARRGLRLIDKTPFGHWRTSTFIGALRHDGLIAPGVFDGAINGDLFLAWVEQILLPVLRPGDTVVMDNLSWHKVAGVRAAIEGARANLLYLPPYSPDLNPIEMLFAKLKAIVRSIAAKTIDALWHAISAVSTQMSPEECANFIRHAGYFQSP